MTSNTDSTVFVYPTEHILVKGYLFRAEAPGFRSRRVSPNWLRENEICQHDQCWYDPALKPGEQRGDSSVDSPIPTAARHPYRKGGAALANGKWVEAKTEFEKAVALQPAYFFAWIGVGLADEPLQEWPEAESAYQKVLALRPRSAEPYLRIARFGLMKAPLPATSRTSMRAHCQF